MKFIRNLILSTLVISCAVACKKEPAPKAFNGKRVVQINPINTRFIELEDGARYGMGENLYNRLVSLLKSDSRFVVVVNENFSQSKNGIKSLAPNAATSSDGSTYDPSDRLHFDFPPVAAAQFSANVDGLTFTHGSRGVRNFSGFRKDYITPWNSGDLNSINEFPQRSLEIQPSWFGSTFDPIGSSIDNTITGVDTGEEGEFNIVIASVFYRRDSYLATAQLGAQTQLYSENVVHSRAIEAQGSGFLFALGVSYEEFSASFSIAKRDALKQTFDQGADLMAKEIADELSQIPFRTKVEDISPDGIIINAGRREGVKAGDQFTLGLGGKSTVVQVTEVFQIGAIVKVVSGRDNIGKGDVLTMLDAAAPSSDIPKISLSSAKGASALTASELLAGGTIQDEPRTITFDPPEFSLPNADANNALQMKNIVLLPYLLIRWALYDQDYNPGRQAKRNNILNKAQSNWNLNTIHLSEAWQSNFSKLEGLGKGVRIAIIDSGVDYNHDNLQAAFDPPQIGWDFFSDDSRPFDDNSHGTAIAGIIAAQGIGSESVGIAPDATILSYRVFNPYGETRSSHIYGAFMRAIQDGARIIVTAWDTELESQTIAQAIKLAEQNGVLVIAASGDKGKDLNKFPTYPAVYNNMDNLISVAAIDQNLRIVQRSGRYSNFGASYVDIAAPGDNLHVLAPRNNYLKRTGSDLAAAHVAGAAALLFSKQANLKASEAKQILLLGARQEPNLRAAVANGRILDIASSLNLVH